jgi:TolB protein
MRASTVQRRMCQRALPIGGRVGLVVLIAGMLWFSVGTANATAPGRNGRIAFRRYFNDAQTRGAIFTMRRNGTDVRQVTHFGKMGLDTEPDWSPNGRWIAFHRVAAGKAQRVYKVRANGTHVTLLSHDPTVGDLFPAWSPNGKRIAYTEYDDPNNLVALFVMRANGTHVRQVPGTAKLGAQFAQWSPDGSRLVFDGEKQGRGSAIFTIRLDGTKLRRLTPWKLQAGDGPDWSPDGRWILLESHAGGRAEDNLFLVHPDGTGLHRITSSSAHVHQWGSYSFSPNGRKITVSHNLGAGTNPDIYVLNVDGSGLRRVRKTAIWDSAPDWGPRQR